MDTVKVEASRVEKGEGDIPVCELCRKCFATVSGRNRHRRLHEGERHACQVCTSLFNRKDSLNEHIKSVHQGEKPYPCTECGKDFSHRGNLRQHIKSIHQGESTQTERLRKKQADRLQKHNLSIKQEAIEVAVKVEENHVEQEMGSRPACGRWR